MIDSLAGEEKKKLFLKSTGVGKMAYTHHESCVIVSSDKKTFELKYLCMYDNRVLRNFVGHADKVTSMSMSPIDDNFITASDDKTVCLWNLNSSNPVSKISLPSYCERPYAKFDASGVVFGVMCYDSWKKNHNIKLFDARNYEAGPFQNIVPEMSMLETAAVRGCPGILLPALQKSLQSAWNTFEFSSDGNQLLVNTQSEMLLVLDGFRPEAEPVVLTRKNENNIQLGACFASNSKAVITANEDNELLILDKATGEPKAAPHVGHVSPIACIASNPKYDQIASGCINTVLWIPKEASASAAE